MTQHRRIRSTVTGRYYCAYDGDDWPCVATSENAPTPAPTPDEPSTFGPEGDA